MAFKLIMPKKHVAQRKIKQAALGCLHDIMGAESDMHPSLFSFEMGRHPQLIEQWETDALPALLEATDGRSVDEQKAGLRALLVRLVREREIALQFLFEFDTPQDWPRNLRDDDEREVLIKHLYRSKYRLGGVKDYARQWGRVAIMDDATIYMARFIGAGFFDDVGAEDWFSYYMDAVSRMVFHSHEAAIAAEKGREYEAEKLVRAYEKLLDKAEKEIVELKDFSFSRLEFERSVLEKKGRSASLLQDAGEYEERPSIYLGD